MPVGEKWWNPYRFVPLKNEPVKRGKPANHGELSGLIGVISCRLTALTPIVVGQNFFIRRNGIPCIPGTSLKGVIRSICEIVANGCSIVDSADEQHSKCWESNNLCTTCQMFGFVNKGNSYQGNVSISDALLKRSPRDHRNWEKEVIGLSSPKITHKPFYGKERNKIKIYHHQAGKTRISNEHLFPRNSKMKRIVEVAPAGSEFVFDVEFRNLTNTQLDFLLYALVLEPEMAHKVGGARPLGAGSSKIDIEIITLNEGRAMYMGEPERVFTGQTAMDFVNERTKNIRADKSETMEALRVLMLFDKNSRKKFQYPNHLWFADKDNSQKRLRTWREFAER